MEANQGENQAKLTCLVMYAVQQEVLQTEDKHVIGCDSIE